MKVNMWLHAKTGVVGIISSPSGTNNSPTGVVRYRVLSLNATLSLTLTLYKSMVGGLWFQGDYDSFHTGQQ